MSWLDDQRKAGAMRDCEHGQLARRSDLCERDKELTALRAENAELKAKCAAMENSLNEIVNTSKDGVCQAIYRLTKVERMAETALRAYLGGK